MRRIFFTIACLLLLLIPARAANVVGSISNSFGIAYGGSVNTIQFTPLSAPQQVGTATIWPVAVSQRLTNGYFNVNLVGGVYNVGLLGDNAATGGALNTVRISVPANDSDTHQFTSLATNLPTFTYTNQIGPSTMIVAGAGITAVTNNAGDIDESVTLSAWAVVPPPAGITPPWTVYRSGASYFSGVDLSTLNVSRDVTLYVDPSGDDANDGSSWALAKETLAGAEAEGAGQSMKIYVAPGTYGSGKVTFTNRVSLISTGGVVTLGPVLARNYTDLYAQGIDFDGGIGWVTAASSNRFTCVDSRFFNSASNGVSVRVNAGQTYMLRCSAFTNTLDGFNYHWNEGPTVTAWALEENCTGYGNGSGLSDNGSTGHDGWWVLRIGGAYWGNSAYNVIDIGNGGSWNIGVKAGGSFGANNWAFASGNSTDTTRMVMEDCQQVGSGGWITALTGTVSMEEVRPVAPPITASSSTGGNTNLTLTSTSTKVGYLAADVGQFGATLGHEAGRYAQTTLGMVALSPYAFLYATNASYGIAAGYAAAQYNADASQSLNLGVISARYASNNVQSLNLGYGAGEKSTNNASSINLGYYSGTNRHKTLWVETLATSFGSVTHPLIYGEFDNRFLRFGADVSVMSNMVVAGESTAAEITVTAGGANSVSILPEQIIASGDVNAGSFTTVGEVAAGSVFGTNALRVGTPANQRVAVTADGIQLYADDGSPSASLTWEGGHAGDGSGLTGLNASALASGTVPSERLPPVFGGATNATMWVWDDGTNTVYVRQTWDSTYDLVWVLAKTETDSPNGAFDYVSLGLQTNTVAVGVAPTLLSIELVNDETYGWLTAANGRAGGGHAIEVCEVTKSAHGLTSADIGKRFQDSSGKGYAVCGIVSESVFQMVQQPIAIVGDSLATRYRPPGGTTLTGLDGLSDVTGWTETYSGVLTSPRSSVRNQQQILVDGRPLQTNEIVECSKFEVVQSVEAPNIRNAYNYFTNALTAGSWTDPALGSMWTRRTVYRWWPWNQVTVEDTGRTTAEAGQIRFNEVGNVYFNPLLGTALSGATNYWVWIPGITNITWTGSTINGVSNPTKDFNEPQCYLSGSGIELEPETQAHSRIAGVLPDFVIQLAAPATNSHADWGFSSLVALDPTWEGGIPSNRLVHTKEFFRIQGTTRKIYPMNFSKDTANETNTVIRLRTHRRYSPLVSGLDYWTYVRSDENRNTWLVYAAWTTATGEVSLPLPGYLHGLPATLNRSLNGSLVSSNTSAGTLTINASGANGFVIVKLN